MPQINVSISFNSETEMHLYDAINTGKRSGTVKEIIAFWLKYKDLLPQLDNTSDLLSIVAQIANEQARMMDMVVKLEDKLQNATVATEGKQEGDNWGEEQLDMMGEFE